jgi:hypothetical protein
LKVIIAGGRDIHKRSLLDKAIVAAQFKITEVVSGHAKGVDTLGELWADFYNVPVKLFPADWETHGKRAGFIRNAAMAEYADALIAVWDGKSKGTQHMIETARTAGLTVFVLRVRKA